MKTDCVIVIPALNPPAGLSGYVEELRESGFEHILIINDGSRTDKLPVFLRAQRAGALILTHEGNKGQGAALKTGFVYYLEHFQGKTDGIIALSADRPLPVEEVQKVASSLHNEQKMGSYAVVLGCRNFADRRVTDYDYRMNSATKLCYHMLMGVHLEDPMTTTIGLPDLRVRQAVDIAGEGFEYNTALLMSFEKIGFLQVPVSYSLDLPDVERTRKKRDTSRIIFTLIRKFVLYSVTSLSASLIDIIFFSIFTTWTFRGIPLAILYSTISARVISASVNYILTKHFVFHFKSNKADKAAKSAGGFMILTATQCLLSALLVSLLKMVLGGSATGFKVFVDLFLFFVSYKVQHKYIFKDDAKKKDPVLESLNADEKKSGYGGE